jgi:hypothetical protein
MSANTACVGHGYDALTSVHSSTENDIIRDGPPNSSATPLYYWIGLNDRGSEGTYVWSDGNTFDGLYTAWDSFQPDNGFFVGSGNEDCVRLNPSPSSGLWSDTDCNNTSGFVCVSRM